MIAVTFALPAESSEFLKLLQNPIEGRIGDAEFTCGSLAGKHVCVLHTGVGERAARPRVQHFLAHQPPEMLISSGFAGALRAELEPGDLLLADNFSAPQLLVRAREALGHRAHVGPLATAGAVVDSAPERAALAAQTPAVAVDMETEFIADACRAGNVPMISLRAISDTPRAPLPAPASVLFDVDRQKTSFAGLSLYIVRHPVTLWRLGLFARRIAVARRSMTRALAILVQRGPAATHL